MGRWCKSLVSGLSIVLVYAGLGILFCVVMVILASGAVWLVELIFRWSLGPL